MLTARYRFYIVHKYVLFVLTEFERQIARADFNDNDALEKLRKQFQDIAAMMKGHAAHETEKIHELLRKKNSTIQADIELEHQSHDAIFDSLSAQLEKIQKSDDANQRKELGYHFYLSYREFEKENLEHLNAEETVLLPELQRLYSDEELLNEVDAKTYAIMTPEQILNMLHVLLPHVNRYDREEFIENIRKCAPEKLDQIRNAIDVLTD